MTPQTNGTPKPSAATQTPADRAAQLIADNLATGLTHPGDPRTGPALLQLPAFNTVGMPPQLAQHVTATTTLISQAITHLLASHALTIIDTAELDHLRSLDPDAPQPSTVTLDCPHHQPLLHVKTQQRITLTSRQINALAETFAHCAEQHTG